MAAQLGLSEPLGRWAVQEGVSVQSPKGCGEIRASALSWWGWGWAAGWQ